LLNQLQLPSIFYGHDDGSCSDQLRTVDALEKSFFGFGDLGFNSFSM